MKNYIFLICEKKYLKFPLVPTLCDPLTPKIDGEKAKISNQALSSPSLIEAGYSFI